MALAPILLTELRQPIGLGAVSLAGQVPTALGDGAVEATLEPGVGTIYLGELAATISTDSVRGHVTVKKRRRGARIYSVPEPESAGPAVSLPIELTPVPTAIFDPPATRIAGIDTSEAHARLSTIETRRARQRREDEELIAILMRAA